MFHSDACNAKALCNESMTLKVLEAEEPAVFCQELFDTLVHYYEEIAGGRPKPKSPAPEDAPSPRASSTR